jgi:hypothetical protein
MTLERMALLNVPPLYREDEHLAGYFEELGAELVPATVGDLEHYFFVLDCMSVKVDRVDDLGSDARAAGKSL